MKATIKISIITIAIFSCLTSCGSGGIGGGRENLLETIQLFPVKMGNGSQDKYCYVDKTGKVVIEGNYDYASLFYEGIAAVYPVPREVRYINEKGEFITPDVYAKGTPFSEGIAFVQIGTRISDGRIATAINTKGEQLFKINTEETGVFREGLAAFRSAENGLWGFVNKKGEVVISPTLGLSYYVHFSHGKLFVRGDNNKWGVINAKGEQIIDYKYEEASEFDENDQAVVKCENYLCAIIDDKGNYILPPQSDYSIESDGDLYRIQSKERKIGWMDKNGKVIIEPTYEYRGTLYFSRTDLVYTTRTTSGSEYECGYINRKGEMVLKCDHSDFNSPFMGDVAIIGGRNYWFINKKGERVSETFNDIGELENLGHSANGDGRYTCYRW